MSDAAGLLGLDEPHTRRLLAYLARRGWLARVRRGLYTPVPLDANVPGQWSEDPWLAATVAFAPCYIGGWSALEHWGLTEQLFRTLLVFTTRRLRHRTQALQAASVRLKVVRPDKLFGTVAVWRHQTRVAVSDASRTIIDALDDPSVGGGMRHVATAVAEYFGSEEHRNDALLVEYGDRVGNRAVFKRLGYLLESLKVLAPDLLAECRKRRSAGLSVFDPGVEGKGRIVKRWGLRVNVDLSDVETWS
ncbi:MAG: type IV toxin-antitoxin system AbiEi family antitoxin domain-containing protein [Acidobacteria bacterium]|nr:type IV toxin-antitoxin system AbiEi family antitoxin domain-containing protein [Acidobacteriota bacterium]